MTDFKVERPLCVESNFMRKILDEYTANDSIPKALKDKVMQSAHLIILAKDLGELFTLGIGEASQDISRGINLDDSDIKM